MKDYYRTLGIEKDAGEPEIKRAYLRLAKRHHPDHKGGDELKFKEINEAQEVLRDPGLKAKYDEYLISQVVATPTEESEFDDNDQDQEEEVSCPDGTCEDSDDCEDDECEGSDDVPVAEYATIGEVLFAYLLSRLKEEYLDK